MSCSSVMAGAGDEAKADMSKCKGAVFTHSTILCKAGLNEKPLPLTTRPGYVGPKKETFVKLSVRESWLCKAVTGSTTPSHTSIARTTLINDLLTSVKRACDGEIPAEDSAVAGEGEEEDPMNEIETGDVETPVKPKQTRKRARTVEQKYSYTPNAAKNKVVVAEMRQVPEEVDPNNTALRKVPLFIVDRRSVWIPLDDVDWAVKYMYAQNLLKGVGVVRGDSAGPAG